MSKKIITLTLPVNSHASVFVRTVTDEAASSIVSASQGPGFEALIQQQIIEMSRQPNRHDKRAP